MIFLFNFPFSCIIYTVFLKKITQDLFLKTFKMGYPETATGFMVNDQKNWTQFEKKEVCAVLSYHSQANATDKSSPQFPLKPFEDRDIDIAIDACGVCGSDVHTITGQSRIKTKRRV